VHVRRHGLGHRRADVFADIRLNVERRHTATVYGTAVAVNRKPLPRYGQPLRVDEINGMPCGGEAGRSGTGSLSLLSDKSLSATGGTTLAGQSLSSRTARVS
jgi:hypothetical protein